jgi:hypothetical protein
MRVDSKLRSCPASGPIFASLPNGIAPAGCQRFTNDLIVCPKEPCSSTGLKSAIVMNGHDFRRSVLSTADIAGPKEVLASYFLPPSAQAIVMLVSYKSAELRVASSDCQDFARLFRLVQFDF